MLLLQLNTTANTSSTGRIAEDINRVARENGHNCYIAYGVRAQASESKLIRIGNDSDVKLHALKTRLFDRHGFGSTTATEQFVKELELIQPDIIHMHNLHGYYLNVEVLFKYLNRKQIPIVWTFHDCWPFTGHCTFFEHFGCEKWKTNCYECPNLRGYPSSWWIDQSTKNYQQKKALFNAVDNLTIVTPSNWLANLVGQSFLQNHRIEVIHNGVDLSKFYIHSDTQRIRKNLGIGKKKVILGVASVWDKRKGLTDFLQLSELVSEDCIIVLVGLSSKQLAELPKNNRIIGIARTESIEELCILYSLASVFVNPTYLDNFPNTNIEALACGTPVITYKTGGSVEAVDASCGFVIEQGEVEALWHKIQEIIRHDKVFYQEHCLQRAKEHYNKDDRYKDYLDLYQQILTKY